MSEQFMARNSNKVVSLGAVLARNIRAAPQAALHKRLAEPKWKPVRLASMIRLEARAGKEKELGDFLRGSLSLVQQEPATAAWFAMRLSKSTFAVFNIFTDEKGRQAHLTGQFAKSLKEQTRELLAKPPAIEKMDVLAAKLIDFQV